MAYPGIHNFLFSQNLFEKTEKYTDDVTSGYTNTPSRSSSVNDTHDGDDSFRKSRFSFTSCSTSGRGVSLCAVALLLRACAPEFVRDFDACAAAVSGATVV